MYLKIESRNIEAYISRIDRDPISDRIHLFCSFVTRMTNVAGGVRKAVH